jgi:hypothetical protein
LCVYTRACMYANVYICAGVGLAVGGVAVGGYQIGRGVWNTGAYMKNILQRIFLSL